MGQQGISSPIFLSTIYLLVSCFLSINVASLTIMATNNRKNNIVLDSVYNILRHRVCDLIDVSILFPHRIMSGSDLCTRTTVRRKTAALRARYSLSCRKVKSKNYVALLAPFPSTISPRIDPTTSLAIRWKNYAKRSSAFAARPRCQLRSPEAPINRCSGFESWRGDYSSGSGSRGKSLALSHQSGFESRSFEYYFPWSLCIVTYESMDIPLIECDNDSNIFPSISPFIPFRYLQSDIYSTYKLISFEDYEAGF